MSLKERRNQMFKYRGKRIDNGEWVTGSLIEVGKHRFIYDNNYRFSYSPRVHYMNLADCYEVHPESVGMSTGKKDKTGREVYAGDIYECEYGPMVVTYNTATCAFQLQLPRGENDAVTTAFSMIVLDVGSYPYLGNSTDNPDLLEGKAE